MAPGPSPEAAYAPEERARLRDIAAASIRHGLTQGAPLAVGLGTLPAKLREPRATFVTLERSGRLRGCIGTLEARRPLAQDVADQAYAAAFRDPRFVPLEAGELPDLELKISVLSPPEALSAEAARALPDTLRPGIDGLIIEDGPHRATFLPSVWAQLPDPQDFVAALRQKAGLPPAGSNPNLRAFRYTTEEF
ncbi:hypothetical protein BJI67_01585 [Acidihalobacter aeolianus]|uniref:AMMECR1 domain-containing protein n=1 Tax=Acidihalobacter aeolianus TaxID=2792603 RepID=A0A1D8K4Q3_9GAMM|nr:AmmeMemoRadiSam system protein A [Acidihalobacter aeolianus]AOV15937.1 hypothetical protein BJI67_01585 [Acidihalobacter aeolianus]